MGRAAILPARRTSAAAFCRGRAAGLLQRHGSVLGNPVYDWQALRRDGYRWWIERLRACSPMSTWSAWITSALSPRPGISLPGRATAETGSWVPGPGTDFFAAAQAALGTLPFVAEDLGLITPDVVALRDRFGLPGMRVLQFAFDGMGDNPHSPANYAHNTVVYTGTHDNPTTHGWFEALPQRQQQNVWDYLRRPARDIGETAPALIELAWNSAAALAMTPLQDLLNLGDEARMNQPGRTEGNWCWRCTEAMRSGHLAMAARFDGGREPGVRQCPGTH